MSGTGAAPVSSAKLALAIKRLRSESSDADLLQSDPIAIIGIGCRFPGNVHTPDEYWRLLCEGTDATTNIPVDRWSAEAYFDPDISAPGKINTRRGGFLGEVDRFDPLLFGIAPREAASMDPQQRLLLEVAWEAIWDSGNAPEALGGSRTGVFAAIYNSDYARLLLDDPAAINAHTCAGASHAIASGRISYLLDLRGPSLSIDTACSSSLVAVHLACQSLRSRDCDLALSGGVTLHLRPEHHIALAKLGMLSPEGQCKTFDAAANGFVPGEGCGLVVLKRLADALADGNRVYAVIRGTALNQDGRTSVMTAPNGMAQREVIKAALANARVAPGDIAYVETHGTGTALGDPIEVEALADVIGETAAGRKPCALGAAKTNLGHLEAASGIAGLIKAALALDREEIPPNLHYRELNPHLSLENTRFFVPTTLTPWQRNAEIRFAGVSSFGFSGTNAHVVLEESPRLAERTDEKHADGDAFYLLPISARTPEALKDYARLYRDFLADDKAGRVASLKDVCYTAATRRHHYEDRLVVTANTRQQFCDRLGSFVEGHPKRGVSVDRTGMEPGGIAFVFSGQGSQWIGMGRSLFDREPVFRKVLEECAALVREFAGWSLLDELCLPEGVSRLQRTQFAQPALLAVEVALARLWNSWGIHPRVVIGHSAGEVAAAHISGALELSEAIRLVVHRGRVMERATGLGKMAVVHLPAALVLETLSPYAGRVSVAAMNSPESTVISGEPAAVEELVSKFRQNGVGTRMMPVDYAFHSPSMLPLSRELVEVLGSVSSRPQTVPMISTVSGKTVSPEELDVRYWANNVRQPVLFRAAIESAMSSGIRTFVEVAPHPVLLTAIGECLEGAATAPLLISSLRRNAEEREELLSSLGKLHAAGHSVNWRALYPKTAAAVSLPAYPYQRQKFWIAPSPRSVEPDPAANNLHPLLGTELRSPSLRGRVFEVQLTASSLAYLADHRIENAVLLPMAAFLEMASAAIYETTHVPHAVADMTVIDSLLLPEEGVITIQTVVEEDSVRFFSFENNSWKLHASCRIADAAPVGDFPLAAELSTVGDPAQAALHYDRLHENGVSFGPAFRTVRSLNGNDSETVARIQLNATEMAGASEYGVHPALLDGCLQTLVAAAKVSNGPYLPLAIDRYQLYKTGASAAWAQVRVRPASSAGTVSGDITVLNEAGMAIARIEGLHLKLRSQERSKPGKLYEIQWQRAARGAPVKRPSGAWLILSNNAAQALTLSQALRNLGQEVIVAKDHEPTAEWQRVRGIVQMVPADPGSALEREQLAGCGAVLQSVQNLGKQAGSQPPQLWVVTSNSVAIQKPDRCEGLSQSSVWGLARTIRLEHPGFRCVSVDLEHETADLSRLAEELTEWDGEEEVVFREAQRFVPRLEPKSAPVTEPRRLTIAMRGSVENLVFETLSRRSPGPGEVEVGVETSALNFRDVLNVLGMYPGDAGPLGLEFYGRITRVGENITEYRPGDRVMGLAWESFASFVTTPAALICRVMDDLSPEQAATLPNAFLTAYHCLHHLGRLAQGQRVLIHAASGGVGLAAVQLAKQAGAEIFATAGSDEKRDYLRSLGVQHVFSSRTLAFADQILSATGGRGVDLILNSLAGDFIDASFATLAVGGRFVEIGKTGIWSNERVMSLQKQVEYSVVDLAEVIRDEPALIRDHLRAISRLLERGQIEPLPARVFEFDDAPLAFRYMAQAKHIGKIVLRHPGGLRVTADATYLITGGLGAIGLRIGQWLLDCGAKHLVLMGRTPPANRAATVVDEMRATGARIEIRTADICERSELQTILTGLRDVLPPVRGIIHAAGIVDDGVLMQQTWERISRVMAPKVRGAWNLHELTLGMPLDFFVLCSSVASVLGSPGQGGYAAGNAFLDELARYRQARGLPGLSINWGAWSETGMAARVEAGGRRRVLECIRSMPAEEYLECFEGVLETDAAQIVIADADWERCRPAPQLLSGLIRRSSIAASEVQQHEIGDRLRNAPSGNKRKVLIGYLREEAIRVLGLDQSLFIDEHRPLIRMGLDSLMAVEFRNRVAAALGRSFSATLLFDHPTIGALADFLLGNETPVEATDIDPVLEGLEALSDEEAEILLSQELERQQ